jgi:hypothetical protein
MKRSLKARIRGRLPEAPSAATFAALAFLAFNSTALAAEKPPLAPDPTEPLTTPSRISATIEVGLPAIAADIERDIPRRLATIDERVNCVHRRVFIFKVNANCDIWGYVERPGPVILYGRGDKVYGSVPIRGVVEGQGANRFTARIHGETEASALIEVESRPQIRRDWSLDLNLTDGFHWSEPPVLHVLGRSIPISRYVEPRMRTQLAKVREKAIAAARRLDLRGKAESAWRRFFEPIKLYDDPEIWLQLTPQTAAFAGVRADTRTLRGSLELTGSAETFLGQRPPTVAPTEMPPLGQEVQEPGVFDVLLPIRISYDSLKDKINEGVAALAPNADVAVRDVQVYPSAGKLIVGLRVGRTSDPDPGAGQWIYLGGALQPGAGDRVVQLSDLAATSPVDNQDLTSAIAPMLAELRDKAKLDYASRYDDLIKAANERLNRPLKDGFRMEGHLSAAKLEKVVLGGDGILLELRVNGELKILYGS